MKMYNFKIKSEICKCSTFLSAMTNEESLFGIFTILWIINLYIIILILTYINSTNRVVLQQARDMFVYTHV